MKSETSMTIVASVSGYCARKSDYGYSNEKSSWECLERAGEVSRGGCAKLIDQVRMVAVVKSVPKSGVDQVSSVHRDRTREQKQETATTRRDIDRV